MHDFFDSPNLPSHKVKTLIIGEDYCKSLEPALKLHGVRVLGCPRNPFVDERLASHADLSIFHLGGEHLLLAAYLKGTAFVRELEALGAELVFSENRQGRAYPEDANLCAFCLGENIYHNEKICDRAIRAFGGSLVHTSQGYAKCAVSAVTENAVITADEGMAGTFEANNVDVLRISSAGVVLEGFPNGFIGGASFKLSPELLAFTGSLSQHPDREKIESFLRLHGVRPVYLSDERIIDIGSAIPIF